MKRSTVEIVAIAIILTTWTLISGLSLIGIGTLVASLPRVLQIVLLAFAGIFDTGIFAILIASMTKNIQ